MASDFVTFKQKRKGSTARYMRWIPTDLQLLFNGKKARTKLLTGTPASEVAEVVRAMQESEPPVHSGTAADDLAAKP